MPLSERRLAEAAHRSAMSRLRHYAEASVAEVRQGDGWIAVRTGVESNDLNGVVSVRGADVSSSLAAELIGWFADCGTPASWLTERADERLTEVLVKAGASPERSGRWSGCAMLTAGATAVHRGADVDVVRVTTEGDLASWLDLAAACGWILNAQDRETRRRLYSELVLGHDAALRNWLAVVGDVPVCFASSYVADGVVDLCNLGVLASHRRHGIGRAMTAARIADGAKAASTIVSAPSHDGWLLQRSLGFSNVPVVADTCFYLHAA